MSFSLFARRCAAVSFAAAFAAPALAHITLEYQVANADSYYKANFKVGHGCGKSPMRQLVVQIPAGVRSPHPMPKPGWALEIAADGSRVSWTAKTKDDWLSAEHYDEFALQAKLPAKEGTLYWKVSQICEEGRNDWAEEPSAGKPAKDLKSPAAVLEILPISGAGGHKH